MNILFLETERSDVVRSQTSKSDVVFSGLLLVEKQVVCALILNISSLSFSPFWMLLPNCL
jgi:hypothetical protein